MLFIGNQIRLTRAVLDAAVAQRRESLFQTLARQQIDAGANWLLVDMGPQRKGAAEDLSWLVGTIHGEVSVPLVLRSDDPIARRYRPLGGGPWHPRSAPSGQAGLLGLS